MDDEESQGEWLDEYGEPACMARWHWASPVLRFCSFAVDVSEAAERFWRAVGADVAAHVNYQVQQEEFMSDAARELETILEGNDD